MKKLLIPILALMHTSCDHEMKYPVHQIPAGYEGFVVVVFNQPSFPALPTNRLNQFLHYPADGILITSSRQLYGLSADQAVETETRVNDDRVRRVGKSRQYESGGIREKDGVRMPYMVKAVGSDAYWRAKNPADYAAKIDEAEQKLRRLSGSGGQAAPSESKLEK